MKVTKLDSMTDQPTGKYIDDDVDKYFSFSYLHLNHSLRKKHVTNNLLDKKIAFNCKGTVKKFLPATISYLSFHQVEKRNLYSLDLGLLLWSTVTNWTIELIAQLDQISGHGKEASLITMD
uniref:Uncharacterized protein n=1 Tax=Tetranychus urticae TaxID=32264 RepID=T1K130_TETUR